MSTGRAGSAEYGQALSLPTSPPARPGRPTLRQHKNALRDAERAEQAKAESIDVAAIIRAIRDPQWVAQCRRELLPEGVRLKLAQRESAETAGSVGRDSGTPALIGGPRCTSAL